MAAEMWAGLVSYYGRPLKGEAATKSGCEFLKKMSVLPPDQDCGNFD